MTAAAEVVHTDGWDHEFQFRRARVDLFEVTLDGRQYKARCSASWDEPTYGEWRLERLTRLTADHRGHMAWRSVPQSHTAWRTVETILINHRREHGYAPRPEPLQTTETNHGV